MVIVMKKVKEFLLKHRYLWLTILLTLAITGIIFLLKGIYPTNDGYTYITNQILNFTK